MVYKFMFTIQLESFTFVAENEKVDFHIFTFCVDGTILQQGRNFCLLSIE